MERRKFLIGTGSLAAGAAAITGSGAFTEVQADRDINVNVADDSDAFLEIKPADSPNGDAYAEETDDPGTIQLTFDDNATGVAGSGVNDRALVEFKNVLTIRNSGTQEVRLGMTFGPDGFDDDYSGNQGAVAPTGPLLRREPDSSQPTLGKGETFTTGLFFNLKKDKNADEFLEALETITIHADAEQV
ncbi:hypothetical protein ACFQH2_16615 [Natronoarchaeum sp. GCM10025703]|uniref:hypothetical protein n=1 Tax=unclassified Natronoarchaeum TaxID=2620183 RepID=UPI0036065D60